MITVSREIGEHTYEVTTLPLAKWQRLKAVVWPVLMGMLPDTMTGVKRPSDEQLTDIVRSVSILLPLQEEASKTAVKILQECSKVEGRPGYLSSIGEVYWAETSYAEFGGWLAFALEVQFVPFLRALPLESLGRLSGAARESRSQVTSTGPSGT